LNIRPDLLLNDPAAVEFTRDKAGEIVFACGMNVPSQPSRYNRSVRRAAVLALLFAVFVVAVSEPLYCPDGCGQSDLGRSHQDANESSVDCLFCQTAALPVLRVAAVPAFALTRMPAPLTAPYVSPSIDKLEHPPRT
jgi:hypothetical protein